MSTLKHRLWLSVLWFVLLVSAFSYAWVPLRTSQDDWWHLKTGQWIVENCQLPVYDIFTYTGANTVWYNHEWLSQVVFWIVYSHCGGLLGLLTFKALWVVLIFGGVAWLAYRRCGVWSVALVVAWLCAEISRRGIYVRPPLFSYALFALYLGLFDAWKRGNLSAKILSLVTLPLMMLWANLHGMYLLGIIVCGAYAAGDTVEWLWSRRKGAVGAGRCQCFLWVLVGGLIAAACVNPYGWKLFFLGSKFMNDPYLSKVINEMMMPPFFIMPTGNGGLSFVPGFFAFWFVGVLFLILLLWRHRLPCVADLLLCSFFLYEGFAHWRLLPLFSIVIAGSLSWLIVQSLPVDDRRRRYVLGGMGFVCIMCAVVMISVVGEPPPQTFLKRNALLARGETMDVASYPEPVVRFIERAGLPDNMFSPLNYCGYFMWRLAPETHKLFTDNRFDIWGSRWWLEHEIILSAAEKHENVLSKSWRDLLDEHGVNFLVLNRDALLQSRLVSDAKTGGEWSHVYYWIPPGMKVSGHGFSVWLRNNGNADRVALVERCQDLFRDENPGRVLPSALDD